jgi:ATP phosphoribosyltransferase
VALLDRIGIQPTVDPDKSRKLVLPSNREGLQFLIIRAQRCAHLCRIWGGWDLGIAGKDVLAEYDTSGLCGAPDLALQNAA